MLKEIKIEKPSDVGSGRVFLEFYGPACGFCRAVEPIVESLSGEFSDVDFLRVNAEKCQNAASLFGIRGLPTFIAIKDGQELGRLVGAKKAPELRSLAEKVYG